MVMMNSACCILLIFVALVIPFDSGAQELSPRAYWPSPIGTHVLTLGYSYASGDVVPDRSLPITGVDSSINSLHIGYRYTLDLWGRTANITIEGPYTDGNTVGTHEEGLVREREYRGVGDLAATFSINILGAPAMTRPEFVRLLESPRPILGVSLKLVAPTGNYESDRLINVGANRWAVKAELGYIASLAPKWLLEASLGGWFFADNNDFLSMVKEQNPVISLQGHLIHRFRPGLWASLDVSVYRGGRSTIGGQRLDDLQRDSKIGATVVFPFASKHAVKLGYSIGSLNDSDESFRTFVMSYQRLY